MSAKTLTLRLPLKARPALDVAARELRVSSSIYARKLCSAALASRPDPGIIARIPEPRSPGFNIVVTLPAEDDHRLSGWRDAVHSVASDGHFVSGLCLAQLDIGLPSAETESAPASVPDVNQEDSLIFRITDAMGQSRRLHQAELFTGIQSFFAAAGKRVLFAEASTGVGKTRAAIAASIARLDGHPERVAWVTSPTIAVLKQWHAELTAIKAVWPRVGGTEAHPPRWRMMLGRSEFVSEEACRDLATEEPRHAPRILEWLAGGALHPDSPHELPAYLYESLVSLLSVDGLPGSIRLTADTPTTDPGVEAYAKQFTNDGAQIVLLTHAMLATEIRSRLIGAARAHKAAGFSLATTREEAFAARRAAVADAPDAKIAPIRLGELMAEALSEHDEAERRLPDCDHLIVDEAHVLEQSIANALAYNFSFTALLRNADRLSAEAKGLKAAPLRNLHSAYAAVAAAIEGKSSRDGSPKTVAVQGTDIEPVVRHFHIALKELLEFSRPKAFRSANLRNLQMASRALSLALPDSRMGNRAYLRASPVLMNPQLICGRSEIELEMAWLWMSMAPKSVLISATLATGEQDLYRIAQRQLHVPSEAAHYLTPITPSWLTEPVTLLTPAAGLRPVPPGGRRFTPPASSSRDKKDEAFQAWMNEIAQHIRVSMTSAAGGGLVLANSYSDLTYLSELLAAQDPLVVVRGTRVNDYERRFYERCLAGKRPLLMAAGQAWTGIDIGGHQLQHHGFPPVAPGDDNILTDLFTVRLPFGLNSTVTHLARIERFGLGVEFAATGQILKQGIGRLVRRAGLPPNRRIHVMDGRLTEDISANAVRPCKVVLSPYQLRQIF